MRRPVWSRLLFAVFGCVLFCSTIAVAYLVDASIYLPTNYYSFVPPAAGGSYADPVFGTTLTRISDAANLGVPSVEAEYSTKSPFNADNSKILLVEFSQFALYDGVTLQRIKALPAVSASSEPLWSRTDPNLFYFHTYNSNQLMTYNVATGVQTAVHTFSEYGSIFSQGESEMSYDGDHLVLAGDGRYIFVYTISTNTKGPVFDTNVGGSWDAVYISPNNNVLIAWPTNGIGRYHGEELYDSNMNFLRQVANNDGHKHMTRDTDGSEVLLQTNSNDPAPIPNCQNGIVKINLATVQQTCLVQLDWSLAVHVSAPDQDGWAFVETYNVSSASSPWYTYTNELLQVKLDGTEVRRLAHHRSNTSSYDGQPHISVSRDGSRFTFNSNMMGSTTNVYMVPVVTATGPSITTSSLLSGTQNTVYGATLTAMGGTTPYTWSIASGSLPAGLTLASSTGAIAGTPTVTGTSSFTVQVTDAKSLTATQALSITVNAPISITTTSLPGGTQNTSYSATLTATGGAAPYSWSIASGSLPAGLTLAPSTTNSTVISGTPAGTGTSSFTVMVTDPGTPSASKPLSITINASGGSTGTSTIALVQSKAIQGSAQQSISLGFPSNNTQGNLIIAFVRMSTTSQTVAVSDSTGNAYTDAISQIQTRDGHQIHIYYAKNIVGGANKVTASFSAKNNNPYLAIYEYSGLSTANPLDQTAHAQGFNSNPFTGLTGTTISTNELEFAAAGMPTGYTGTITAGSGYAMELQNTGTARAANEEALTTSTGQYAGSFSLSSSANWSIVDATFIPAPAISSAPPSITTTSLPSGTQSTSYSSTLAATGGTAPYSWSIVSGGLPAGLTLGASTGVIAGTPTGTGTSSFTIQVTDSKSLTATKSLSITINPGITSTPYRIEQDNSAVSYAGPWAGVWSTVKNSTFSGGSAIEAMDNGSTATLTFVGTGISWIGYKDQWSGIAQVYLDGNLVGQIDTYSATTVSQAVPYIVTGLPSGNHQLTIKVTGQKNTQSGGSWIWVDAFDIQP